MPPPSHDHAFGSKGTGEPRAPPARRPTAPTRAPRSGAQSGRSGPHGLPCPGPEAGHGPAGGRRARGEANSRAAGPRLPPYTHLITPSLPSHHDDPPGKLRPLAGVRVQRAGRGAPLPGALHAPGPGASLHPHLPAGAPLPPGVAHSPPQRATGHPQRRPPNQPPVMGVMPGGHLPTGDWSSLPPPSLPPTDTAALRTCGPELKGLLHTQQP
ncbi:unnamed protein product [Nyctereutes procyonoides]|uniref:(raccoon dog) hypothetical protein n=1 Tax=Nyctereutes procyonoides TaxID=34880 RepID=A0A811YZ21_NYCPR|nr:unnamed protein product [Nyctereutes procyonoides]